MVIIQLWFFWRVVTTLFSYLATFTIPYAGNFPYKDVFSWYNGPEIMKSLASFDGLHYILIAKNGYSQYEQAFFPLYPLAIKYVSYLFSNNYLITGLIISNLSFIIGLWIFEKYLKLLKVVQPYWIMILLLLFPSSFFFGALYTEGLFFLLLISSLYFLKKKNYALSGICAFFASLTRLIGVFLIIPFGIEMIKQIVTRHSGKPSLRRGASRTLWGFWSSQNDIKYVTSQLFLLISPLLGLFSYMLYLWQTTGDPLFFINSQPAFGANRSTHIIFLPQVLFRYLKIFVTAAPTFSYFVSIFEFIIFLLVGTVLVFELAQLLQKKDIFPSFDRIGLNLFSLAILIFPTFTGTFSSIPRYALFSLSFFISLGQIKNIYAKTSITIIMVITHIFMFAFFMQGYFVS